MRLPKGTTEHPINTNRKKKILVSVWDFSVASPQTERKHYLYNSHPAKMRPSLARTILQLYGESPVLDPMAGIGTTLIEAMLLGMDAIGVEIERKFVKHANKNNKHVKKTFSDKNIGNAICFQGDARDLSFLNKPIKSILFSPPYFNAIKKGDEGPHATNKRISYKERVRRIQGYSADKSNIGNISQFGSIVFSPPLGEANKGGGIAKRGYLGKHGKDIGLKDRCDRPISNNPNNISNSRYGQTYLSEMFKIYSECYRVLKPGKFMVIVVKDIQRRWKTIPLGANTIKLCQAAGFDCHDIIINKMYFPSFWMLNLAKKSQTRKNRGSRKYHVMKTHEYVLVFRKPK